MSDHLRDIPDLESQPSQDQPDFSLQEPPEIEAERARWRALAPRIAAGDERACWEFRGRYAAGVRVMLRRSVGAIGLEALLDETMAGALEEIRRGSLQQPVHFVHFVRSVIERQQHGEAVSRRLARAASPFSTVDRLRLKGPTKLMEEALLTFNKREREILVGYYSRGLTRYDLECLHGATGEEIDRLRNLLQEMVRPHSGRKAPARERRAPLVRRAAAAS